MRRGLVALLLTGCTTAAPGGGPGVVCLDRGELGLAVGRISTMLRQSCADGRLGESECRELSALDVRATEALRAPTADPAASGVDWETVMRLLAIAAKAAI